MFIYRSQNCVWLLKVIQGTFGRNLQKIRSWSLASSLISSESHLNLDLPFANLLVPLYQTWQVPTEWWYHRLCISKLVFALSQKDIICVLKCSFRYWGYRVSASILVYLDKWQSSSSCHTPSITYAILFNWFPLGVTIHKIVCLFNQFYCIYQLCGYYVNRSPWKLITSRRTQSAQKRRL